jgi:hypothetical protein
VPHPPAVAGEWSCVVEEIAQARDFGFELLERDVQDRDVLKVAYIVRAKRQSLADCGAGVLHLIEERRAVGSGNIL